VGRTHDAIDDRLAEFLRRQHVFFVATAPAGPAGHVNLSPKGLCAFEGPPMIVRLYGRGQVLLPDHPEFAALRPRFPDLPGVRAIIRVRCERIADSCGYGVPRYQYQGERTQLPEWADRKGAGGVAAYRDERNAASIDGLPGLDRG
jgi:hypothetical protein